MPPKSVSCATPGAADATRARITRRHAIFPEKPRFPPGISQTKHLSKQRFIAGRRPGCDLCVPPEHGLDAPAQQQQRPQRHPYKNNKLHFQRAAQGRRYSSRPSAQTKKDDDQGGENQFDQQKACAYEKPDQRHAHMPCIPDNAMNYLCYTTCFPSPQAAAVCRPGNRTNKDNLWLRCGSTARSERRKHIMSNSDMLSGNPGKIVQGNKSLRRCRFGSRQPACQKAEQSCQHGGFHTRVAQMAQGQAFMAFGKSLPVLVQ